jgi:hypothetical protein
VTFAYYPPSYRTYLKDPNPKAKPADDAFLELKLYGPWDIAIHTDMNMFARFVIAMTTVIMRNSP